MRNNIVLEYLKQLYRNIRFQYRKLQHRPKNRDELHQYWYQPYDGDNQVEDYLRTEFSVRSKFLLRLIKKHAHADPAILEIGCNVGRNLNFLYQDGFQNLSAIEISKHALGKMQEVYPEIAQATKIFNAPVESVITDLPDAEYDVVFTMAVLEHIHHDSEWIFNDICRITKNVLITIEDEEGLSWRHFPRNYGKIFPKFGMRQIEEIRGMENYGMKANFVTRVFEKI